MILVNVGSSCIWLPVRGSKLVRSCHSCEITSRTDVLDAKPFGVSGAVRAHTGRAYFSVP